MKILITGSNGQLGNALQQVFQGQTLISLDHSQLDISNSHAVQEAFTRTKPDVVINAAAYNNVEKAETDSAAAFAGNEKGPLNLAQSAHDLKIPVVHVSTDYVFDGKKGRPYIESDPVNPLSVYAKSKLAGEIAVAAANPKHFIVRTAWVFHTHGKNFLKTLFEASKTHKLKVVNDQISSPTNALDLAEGIKKLLKQGKVGIVHMAGAGAASRFEQLDFFFQCIGHTAKLTPVSMRAFPQVAERPLFSALETTYGDFRLPDWKDGVRRFAKEGKF